MRETRSSGSEGGAESFLRPYPYRTASELDLVPHHHFVPLAFGVDGGELRLLLRGEDRLALLLERQVGVLDLLADGPGLLFLRADAAGVGLRLQRLLELLAE